MTKQIFDLREALNRRVAFVCEQGFQVVGKLVAFQPSDTDYAGLYSCNYLELEDVQLLGPGGVILSSHPNGFTYPIRPITSMVQLDEPHSTSAPANYKGDEGMYIVETPPQPNEVPPTPVQQVPPYQVNAQRAIDLLKRVGGTDIECKRIRAVAEYLQGSVLVIAEDEKSEEQNPASKPEWTGWSAGVEHLKKEIGKKHVLYPWAEQLPDREKLDSLVDMGAISIVNGYKGTLETMLSQQDLSRAHKTIEQLLHIISQRATHARINSPL